MTYIDYMNQFWRTAEQEPFPASEVALFAFLVNECNKRHWQMPFPCATIQICESLRLSKQTVTVARLHLCEQGLISFTAGSTRYVPSKYSLLDMSQHLTDNLTEYLDSSSTDKDKDQKSQCTLNCCNNLSLTELKCLLMNDTDWLENTKAYLSNKRKDLSSIDLNGFLSSFFNYLQVSGSKKKTIEDTKRHFVNWLLKQKTDHHSLAKSLPFGTVLTDDSLEKYKSTDSWT